MKRAGQEVSPINIDGRRITTTFWGDAWCANLEAYSDFSNRLPRGRAYVRNGSVIDLRIEPGRVRAMVSGTEFYTVEIDIKPLPKKKWMEIKGKCAGQIGSLVELLQGSVSRSVMEIVTRKGEGLFPSSREITLNCSCPDRATMCKHVAATLYGVGARLDREPELLFVLRGVEPVEMVKTALDRTAGTRKAGRGRVLKTDELSSVFGVDINMDGLSTKSETVPKPKTKTKKTATKATAEKSPDPEPKTEPQNKTKRPTGTKKTSKKPPPKEKG
jgi:uncharacterized Zn finger protein